MKNNQPELWHYTTLEGLKGILLSHNFWATDYRYLNDSSEIIHSKSIVQKEVLPRVVQTIEQECQKNDEAKKFTDGYGGIDQLAKIETAETIEILYKSLLSSKPLKQVPFVLSFCKVPMESTFLKRNGLLSQWRGYGKDGGYAVILDMGALNNEFKIEQKEFLHAISGVGEVEYEPDELKKNHIMRKNLDTISHFAYRVYRMRLYNENLELVTKELLEALSDCMMLLKHEGFKEENEYRFYTMTYEKSEKSKLDLDDQKRSFKRIMTRDYNGTVVPYINLFEKSKTLPIKRICIGPNQNKELRKKSLETFLGTINLEHIEVIFSDIPYIG